MRLTLSLEARANGCSPLVRASHALLGVFCPGSRLLPKHTQYYYTMNAASPVTVQRRRSPLILLFLCIFVSLMIASAWSGERMHTYFAKILVQDAIL